MKVRLFLLVFISFLFSNLNAHDYEIQDFFPDSLTTWQVYFSGSTAGEISILLLFPCSHPCRGFPARSPGPEWLHKMK